MTDVVMYCTATCPYCQRAERLLRIEPVIEHNRRDVLALTALFTDR